MKNRADGNRQPHILFVTRFVSMEFFSVFLYEAWNNRVITYCYPASGYCNKESLFREREKTIKTS